MLQARFDELAVAIDCGARWQERGTSAGNEIDKISYLAPWARTNYIKKLIKNIIFMQVMIQTHQYMVDYLLLLQRLDG